MILLCFLHLEMILVQLEGREVMGNNFALFPPDRVHLLNSDMITLGKEIANIGLGPIRVNTSLFNKKLMDGLAIAKNNDIGRSEFQSEDGTVDLSPLTKSIVTTLY